MSVDEKLQEIIKELKKVEVVAKQFNNNDDLAIGDRKKFFNIYKTYKLNDKQN